MEREVALQTLNSTLNAGKVPAKDKGFVESLLAQSVRGLSEKQWYWVAKLASGYAGVPDTKVADFSRAYALFAKAKGHLKNPKVHLLLPKAKVSVKLYVASERSRVPNVVNVVDEYGDSWYGRVYPDGRWEKGTAQQNAPEVESVLQEFASNPEEVATRHGKLTGACCFCNRKLEDDKSTDVGYGPVCAKRWGLSWGRKK